MTQSVDTHIGIVSDRMGFPAVYHADSYQPTTGLL